MIIAGLVGAALDMGAACAADNGGKAWSPTFKRTGDMCATYSMQGAVDPVTGKAVAYRVVDIRKMLRTLAAQNADLALYMLTRDAVGGGFGGLTKEEFLRALLLNNGKLKNSDKDKVDLNFKSSGPELDADNSKLVDDAGAAIAAITNYLKRTPVVRRNFQNYDTTSFFAVGEVSAPGVKEGSLGLYDALRQGLPVYCGLAKQEVDPPKKPGNEKKSAQPVQQVDMEDAASLASGPPIPPPQDATKLAPTLPSQFANGTKTLVDKIETALQARSSAQFMSKAGDFLPADEKGNPSAETYAYSGDSGAKLKLSQAAPADKQIAGLTGALGFDLVSLYDSFLAGDHPVSGWASDRNFKFSVVPYAGINKATKSAKDPTKSPTLTNNTTDLGVVLGFERGLFPSDPEKSKREFYVVNLSYDYTDDLLAHNRFRTVELKFTPYSNTILPINEYCNSVDRVNQQTCGWGSGPWRDVLLGDRLRALWIADLRAKQVTYLEAQNAGPNPGDPRLYKDAVRLGGQVGAALEFDPVAGYPIGLSSSYTDYLALAGFRKDLGLTDVTASVQLGSTVGAPKLSVSFDRGRRDDTAEAYWQWSVSLGVSF